jgi:hypothetical protein
LCVVDVDDDLSVEVRSVIVHCEKALAAMSVGTALLCNMTVGRILRSILSNQGRLIEGDEDKAMLAVVEDARVMLKNLRIKAERQRKSKKQSHTPLRFLRSSIHQSVVSRRDEEVIMARRSSSMKS